MKKPLFCAILILGALLSGPAMAQKTELSDMELAGICAQGWGPGLNIASDMTLETLSALVKSPELLANSLTQGQHGVELVIPETTITIESIRSDTQFGAFVLGDLTMKITTRITVTE